MILFFILILIFEFEFEFLILISRADFDSRIREEGGLLASRYTQSGSSRTWLGCAPNRPRADFNPDRGHAGPGVLSQGHAGPCVVS